MSTVYIVHHIDTEGPLHEPVTEIFKRIENTYPVKLSLKPTPENLLKLQRGELPGVDPSIVAGIKMVTDPHLVGFKSSWWEVDEMLLRMMSPAYRNTMKDSFGNGWIYNWHILDHVGFLTNERRRDMGYLNIFNHYEEIINRTNSSQDELHWHFHPIPFFKEAHIPATSYENSFAELHQVLCRRLIDKKWFPRVNRAGFHTIRPDSNFFLEQWIPFDASNQSQAGKGEQKQLDAINGRFGNWEGAPSDWSLYHPDLYDWRKQGTLQRTISRCLNLRTRFRNISECEIERAFAKAEREQKPVYLGVTNHDFREMSTEIEDFYGLLVKVSGEFPNVKFKFSGAIQAFRETLGYTREVVKANAVKLAATINQGVLRVTVESGKLFGAQPYLAMRTTENRYLHDNFDFGESGKEFFYTFDRYTLPLHQLKNLSIASNDKFGNTSLLWFELENGVVVTSGEVTQN